ncbi:MAG: hypothetical protein WCB04_08200 [Mycobacteriales bacterium]
MTEPPDEDDVEAQRSADDTDTGWGDDPVPDPDGDTRRYDEDRPPHWEP